MDPTTEPQVPAADLSAAEQRLARLFRRALGEQRLHPLYVLLRHHRGLASALPPATGDADPRLEVLATPVKSDSFATQLDSRIARLPPLPEALRAVWQALDKETLSIAQCVGLIEQDSVLAGRTLRMANSAFYGLAGRVARIGDAVNLLGLRAIAAMLAAISIGDALKPAAAPTGWSLRGYTRHAVGVAVAARVLAPRLGQDPEQAFLAGLMHDIGQLVLVSQFPTEAAIVYAHAQSGDLPGHVAEQAVLGLDHAEIGARLARHWHFPAPISQAMAHHHRPATSLPAGMAELAALVHVGDALAHALDLAGERDDAVPALDAAAWLRLHLDEPAALAMLARVEAEARAMAEALVQPS